MVGSVFQGSREVGSVTFCNREIEMIKHRIERGNATLGSRELWSVSLYRWVLGSDLVGIRKIKVL